MPRYYTHGVNAVKCPACGGVFIRQGVWVHIIGKAKYEALQDGKQPHFKFLKTKAKRVPVTKYSYKYDNLKIVAQSFYDWRRKRNKKKNN